MEEFDEDLQEAQSGKKNGGWKKMIVILLLLAIAGGGIYYDTYLGKGIVKGYIAGLKKDYGKKEANDEKSNKKRELIELETDNKTMFRVFDKDYVQCSKDGIRYFSGFENQKWNDTFTMSSPSILCDGNYMAVADVLGRTVRVYNENGFVYEVQSPNTISRFNINKNGYLGLIINNKNSYIVSVYNDTGTKIADRMEKVTGVYPVAMDISDDNKVMAVSYVDSTDIEIVSKVLFFYTDREGEEYTDNMFAAIDEKKGQIIPEISFMEDGKLIAVSDRSIFAADEKGVEVWSVDLTNKLDAVFLDGGNYVVIANGDSFIDADGKPAGTVEWIGLDGKTKASFEAGDTVTYLNGNKDAVVIGVMKDYYAVNNAGKQVWHHKATQDVSDILFLGKTERVLYVTKNYAEIGNIETMSSAADKEEKSPEGSSGSNDSADNTEPGEGRASEGEENPQPTEQGTEKED